VDQRHRSDSEAMTSTASTSTSPLLALPDSALAQGAAALLRAVADDWLVQHSVRTYRFGSALLARVGVDADPELLYVASMLHDVGLGTVFDDGVTPFHLRTAAVAGAFMTTQGRSIDESSLIYDAIALHLDLSSADDARGVVAGVHLGAAADVIGLRIEDVPPEVVEQVLAAHPRSDTKAHLVRVLAAEADRKPYGQAARLVREVAFLDLIVAAPFDE